jgi:sec-independent protein translocase protein TatA
MGRIGLGELIVVAIIAVLLFGAGRLSEIGKGLGDGIRNFKKGLHDEEDRNPDAKSESKSESASESTPKPTDDEKKV